VHYIVTINHTTTLDGAVTTQVLQLSSDVCVNGVCSVTLNITDMTDSVSGKSYQVAVQAGNIFGTSNPSTFPTIYIAGT